MPTVTGDNWMTPSAPRVEPLEAADLRRRDRLVLAIIRRRTKSSVNFTVFRTFARMRGVFGIHAALVGQLLRPGHLGAAEKELVILRVAWRLGCLYEWGHHSHMAEQLGVSPTQRGAITSVPVVGFDERLTAMIETADVLVADRRLDDAAWARASAHLSPDELLELCFLVGHYSMVAMTINSVGVQLEEQFHPYVRPRPQGVNARLNATTEMTPGIPESGGGAR